MEEGDSLRRLLHTATASSRSPVLLVEDNLCEGTASPLQNSLLATLLPGSREPLQASERPFTLPIAKHLQESSSHPLNLMQSRSKLSSGSQSITNSLQELQLNAVHCESLPISQVKNASHRTNMYGSLISVTRHCIAYVLNDRKIRLIAQENAAMGLMELHESTRLPIIDIAWNQQALQATTASGLKQHPSQQLLASLSRGGEVCIGSVFAESASNLVYEPISATTFPELQPAKGLVWNDGGRVPLLALYGSGPEIYLLSVGQSLRSAALTTDLKTIEAVIFGDNGGKVFISSHEMIAIISVESIDETFTAQTIPLPPRVGRVWLHAHSEGVFCVATLDQGQLFILPLFGDLPEVIISIPLPGPQDELFAVFDQVTNVLAIGSMKSTRLLCVSLEKLSDPIVAIGSWPNETSAVSVFATSQLHNVFSKVGDDADMYLYAFHEDSVKMHRLRVSWESTKSADEPDTIPRPSNQILRPASTGPAPSIPKIDASVGNDINRGLLKMKHGNTSDDPKSGKSSTRREPTPVERFSAMNFSGTSESIDSVLKQSIAVSVSRLESLELAIQKALGKQDKLASSVATQLSAQLSSSLDNMIKESIENRLLPGLQSMMSDLVGQLSANLTQAIVESTIEQYKMLLSEMNDVRQSIVELQHRAFKIPSAQELAQTVSNEIRQSLSPVYGATTTQPGSTASLHDEIIALSHARNGLSAMMKVLEEGNIELFNWALPKINMEDVLEGMNLQLPVMLSLAQQLGYDLHTHTELKLDWLAELFTVMDPKVMTDAQLEDTSSAVFEELFANLRVIFAQTPTASPLHKKIKSVMRLVRMIMAV